MQITQTNTDVIGRGVDSGFLDPSEIRAIAGEGLSRFPLDGQRVLVLVPDGTRTMPMPLLAGILETELTTRVEALDFLIATGTHISMNDAQLSRHFGRPVVHGTMGASRVFNHVSDDEKSLVDLGTISASEVQELSGGLLSENVRVRLNRAVTDYDFILICGPVFPHEVAGFSGGSKYLFPGIAGRDIIDFTHWLGALVTNAATIGVMDTPVRRVIERAVKMVPRGHAAIALVTHQEGVSGVYCGRSNDAWQAAAELSSRRHVTYLPRPVRRVLAIMPEMYTDLWTGGKGMYKSEPAVADGGEVIIYAPHIREVSHAHGRIIEKIGYHCRDYFLANWERFKDYPGGVVAHSTHVKGQGTFDPKTSTETPRIQVTLATGISEDMCKQINLGYLNPASVNPDDWRNRESDGWLVIPRAGEMLYRVGAPCTSR